MNSLTELYLRQSITYERDEINILKAKVKFLETQEFALVSNVVTLAVIDAKGDLLVGSADNSIDNLPVGTNDYALIADSLQTLGVKWAQLAAGGIASDAVTTIKILDANVTNAKLAYMVQNTVKGRALGAGTGVPTDLTVTQLNALWGSADAFNASNVVTLGAATDEGRGQMGSTPLKLKGSAALLVYRESADSQGVNLEFLKRRSGTGTVLQDGDQIGSLAFTGADTTTFGAVAARILAEVDGTPGSADMPGRILFLTSPDGSATPTEAMRINALQNLIIANGKRIESDEVRARDSGGLQLLDDGGNLGIFIDDGGKVGIAQTVPAAPLHVGVGADATVTTAGNILIYASRAGTSAFVLRDATNDCEMTLIAASFGVFGTATAHAVRIRANNTDALTIDTSQNVGIGTTSPQGRLHSYDGTGGALFVTKTAVAGTAVVIIANGTGDITAIGFCMYTCKDSGGAVTSGTTSLIPGTTDAAIGAFVNLRCNADGSVDVRRTSGALTYNVALWIVWQ